MKTEDEILGLKMLKTSIKKITASTMILECGCEYYAPYGGCWVKRFSCKAHQKKFPELKERVEGK